jgi:hypothetical protein
MDQTAVASPRPVVTHHLDHAELLLLDNAIARLAERYIANGTLTATQRGVLGEYRSDLAALATDLAGPAREYADQVMALARTVLDSQADAAVHELADGSGGAHRAA